MKKLLIVVLASLLISSVNAQRGSCERQFDFVGSISAGAPYNMYAEFGAMWERIGVFVGVMNFDVPVISKFEKIKSIYSLYLRGTFNIWQNANFRLYADAFYGKKYGAGLKGAWVTSESSLLYAEVLSSGVNIGYSIKF